MEEAGGCLGILGFIAVGVILINIMWLNFSTQIIWGLGVLALIIIAVILIGHIANK